MSTNNKDKLTSTEVEGRDDLYNFYLHVRTYMDDVKANDAELRRKVKKIRAKYNFYVHAADIARVAGGVVGGVRHALHKVEELALSLYRSPWKKELYTLKIHGVLIKNYLQPALTNYQFLLNKLGYERTGNKFVLDIYNEMRKEGHYSSSSINEYLYFVFRDKVAKVAFDLYTLKMNETENIPEKFIVHAPPKGHSPHHSFSGNIQYPTSSHDNTGSDMYGRNGIDTYNNQRRDFDLRNLSSDDQISNITTIFNNVNPIITVPNLAVTEQEKRRIESYENSYPEEKTQVTKHNFGEANLAAKEQQKRMTESYENSYQDEKTQPNKAQLQKFGEPNLTAKEPEGMTQPNVTPNEEETRNKQPLNKESFIELERKKVSKSIIGDKLCNLIPKKNSVEKNENILNDKILSKVNFKNIEDVEARKTEKKTSSPNSSLGVPSGNQPQTQKHVERNSERSTDVELPANSVMNAGKTELSSENSTDEKSRLPNSSESVGDNSKCQPHGISNNECISGTEGTHVISNNKCIRGSGGPATDGSYKGCSGAFSTDIAYSKTELNNSKLLGPRLKDHSTTRKQHKTSSFNEETISNQLLLSKYARNRSFSDEKPTNTYDEPHSHASAVKQHNTRSVARSQVSSTKTSTSTDFKTYISSGRGSSTDNYVNVKSNTPSGHNVNQCTNCSAKEGNQLICQDCKCVLPLCSKCYVKNRFKCQISSGGYHKFQSIYPEETSV
ncbi:uncharacterized protein LOC117105223 [Anneissia japonica]|uniref:uncharacterized protein LOC117105223 n=1 Tax=Anneissia japonica TaxID=1529436 RepID=UPI001425594E|nr:uncharacterized protein LOC117105223 [Anneissia japonica]XP_033102200.1 uncharacterized protein LOC117105223 [Anneissia japonica]